MSIVVILYYLGSNDKEKNPHIRTYSVQLLKKNPRLVKLADVMGHRGTAVDRMKEQRTRTGSAADLIPGQQTVASSVDRKYVFSEKPRRLG